MPKAPQKSNRHQAIIERVFFRHYQSGATEVEFERDAVVAVASELKIVLPT